MKNPLTGALYFIVCVLGLFCFFQYKQISELKNYSNPKEFEFIEGGDISKAQMMDSLYNEIEMLRVDTSRLNKEIERYEIAYRIFLRKNPGGAKLFGDIISNETW